MSEIRNQDYLHTSDENYVLYTTTILIIRIGVLAIFKLKITILFEYLHDYYTNKMFKYLTKFKQIRCTVLQ